MGRFSSILFWSVLAAAFVGPGTVTTAASAGAQFGLSLLWALLFSTVATIVLQEMAARLTIASGLELGDAIARRHGALLRAVAGAAVLLGCAAYEAGNFAGAVRGLQLLGDVPRSFALTLCALAAALLLWFASSEWVARALGCVVALMGLCFLGCAIALRPEPLALLRGSFAPTLPEGSSQLALALVGTTVVPYNLFLGSALARGRSLGESRLGLVVAVALGGLISGAILVVGAQLSGPMRFEDLAALLHERLGAIGPWTLAIGLFAAGLSSAITAPLAAAFAARSVFGRAQDPRWQTHGRRFRAVWGGVLAFGALVGISGLPIIPVIVAAQAVNGLLLPLCAWFLVAAMNDNRLLPDSARNRLRSNLAGFAVLLVAIGLGLRALTRVFGLFGLLLLFGACARDAQRGEIFHVTISAQGAMEELLANWQPTSPDAPPLQMNCASSRDLRAQLERGAPGGLVLLADWKTMNELLESEHFAGAAVAAAFSTELVALAREPMTLEQLGTKRIGIAEAGVPVGDYARQLLRALPGTEALLESAIQLPHEAALLQAIENGALDVAFVYRSSQLRSREPLVEIELPTQLLPRVEYAVATRSPMAAAFVQFLQGEVAGEILRRHGFRASSAP